MGKFNFYYDESEHSRKINHKTITAENYSDSFIAVIVGWLSENQASLYERYGTFEEKYQHRQSDGELKSNTIKQSQLKSGFASLTMTIFLCWKTSWVCSMKESLSTMQS